MSWNEVSQRCCDISIQYLVSQNETLSRFHFIKLIENKTEKSKKVRNSLCTFKISSGLIFDLIAVLW